MDPIEIADHAEQSIICRWHNWVRLYKLIISQICAVVTR